MNWSTKLSKKTIIILIIIFAILGIIIGLLIILLPPKNNIDTNKLYNNLVTSVNTEVAKSITDPITDSKVNNIVYKDHTLTVDYVYNTNNIMSLSFDYDTDVTITTILDEVYANAKLPTYKGIMNYSDRLPISDASEYISILNTTYSKTFTKTYACTDVTINSVFLSGLVKNSDESITTVSQFKVLISTKDVIDPKINLDVTKSTTDKYYLLLDYLLK